MRTHCLSFSLVVYSYRIILEVLMIYIDYSRLCKLLVDKNMKKKYLATVAGQRSSTVSKLSSNQNVNTEVLVKICYDLQCDISDIAEIVITEDNL